jgi:hypothetical protein
MRISVAAVAEVMLDLADDRGCSERGEVYAAARLEAIDGFDQADRPHLHEILHAFATVREPPGKRAGERQVRLDKPLSRREIAPRAIRALERRGLRS